MSQADFHGAKLAFFNTSGTRPGQTLETLKAAAKNGSPLEATLLQRRADDQTPAAVEKRVDYYLAEVAAALK